MRLVALALVIGCTSHEFPSARFANAPAVTAIDDRNDVPKQPFAHQMLPNVDYFDVAVRRSIDRQLELAPDRRALGINALDEVPDSTWFTNRIGVRELTPDEIRRGPMTGDGPDLHKPWTVHSTKSGSGVDGGVIITDTRGIRYMIKFDLPRLPEVESSTDVIVDRLLWACGYHVPEDSIVWLTTDDLVLTDKSVAKDLLGHTTHHITRKEIEHDLAEVSHGRDGRIRALATRWLDGKPLGGFPAEGVREDDPNDKIPHELRRDMRGLYPILAWVDHVDTIRGNFLDMWVRDGRGHHVEHYLVDFGRSLGTMGAVEQDRRRGRTHQIDFGNMLTSLVTVGVIDERWEHDFGPMPRGVSPMFTVDFDPGRWHSDLPYIPLAAADRIDKFWGTKLIGRFTREQIRAAVEAARFSDSRATDYMTDTLVARQRATMAYWYARVNPLDHFTMQDGALCFDDLAVAANIVPAGPTHYAIAAYDSHARAIAAPVAVAGAGHACGQNLPIALHERDAYTIYEVTTRRPGTALRTYVHVARDPRSGKLRVIGVWRV
jgi:hypothetical protein